MIFKTVYPLESSIEESSLFARDKAHAEELCTLRGCGEKVDERRILFPEEYLDRHTLCSEWITDKAFKNAMHSACWLGFHAIKAGVVDGSYLLSDHGFVHAISHFIEANKAEDEITDTMIDPLLKEIKIIEGKIPGMCPVTEEDKYSKPTFIGTLYF